MKKFLAVLFSIFFFAFIVQAQQTSDAPKMSVTSFELAQSDNTANLSGTMVRDQNGDPCALIRVQTTQTGFAWDFGQMQPLKVEQKTGEIWIYVPYGVKRMTVRHARLGTMTYEFPIPVEKARTYTLDLAAANVVVIVEQEVTHQWVVFKLTPKDATVLLDEQPLETRYGQAKKFVPFGVHSYHVFSKNYHPLTGTVLVDNPDNPKTVEIALKSNFAKVTINTLAGADIYANGEYLGLAPWTGNLAFDTYSFEIKKNSYRAVFKNLEFTSESPLSIELPSPIPIYGSLNIDSNPPATIILDDVPQGQTPKFIPKVLIGSHTIKFSAPGFNDLRQTVSIEEGKTETVSAELSPESVSTPVTKTISTPEIIVSDEYVDLGLSVKWATCNLGASKPEESGRYFAWGDVTGQIWNGSWPGWGFSAPPHYELSNNNLTHEFDAVYVNLGGKWRMPTKAEFEELLSNCEVAWTTVNGVKGKRFTSKKPGFKGKSIFLPSAGCGRYSSLYNAGSNGYYWSGTINDDGLAWCLGFNSDYVGIGSYGRISGRSIRPVCE